MRGRRQWAASGSCCLFQGVSSLTRKISLPNRRRVIFAGVIILAALGSAAAFSGSDDALAAAEIVTVGVGDVEDAVTALGKVQPREYVDVGAQVSGQLTRLHVAVGAQVKAGDLLAEIDPALQMAKVEAGRAELARLQAQLADQNARADFARSQLERQIRLKRDNATREEAFEQARMESRTAQAQVDAIRAQIRQTESTVKADETSLGYTRIYAPMSGTVIAVDARQGQTINSTYEAPVLLRIADLSTMTIWTQVSEADVTRLHEGMTLYFTTLGHPGRRWTGSLRQLLPAPPKPVAASGSSASASSVAAASVVLYTALFDADNPKGELRPEMSAQVFFIAAEARGVVTVPVSALTAKDEKSGHFTVQVVGADGKAHPREVWIGVRDRFQAEVLQGLGEGDRIVASWGSGATGPKRIGFRL